MAKKIYYDYTNQVESFGLDECFLDVSGSTKLFGSGLDIAKEISRRMKEEVGLTVSIGLSFCKVFAKLGSDMKKPDAITIIDEKNWKDKVWPQNIEAMVGIGRATKAKLNHIGIYTQGELAEKVNVSLKTISRYELGISKPRYRKTYDLLADALNTSHDYLVTDEEDFILTTRERYGIRATKLRPLGSGSQLDIFTECDKYFKEESCDKALYEIRKKYGKDAISFAALKRDIKLPKELNEIITLPNRHYNS